MPLSGSGEPYGFTIERGKGTSDHIRPSSGALIVTSGYFEALGIPILRGRAFVDQDLENNASVMVINQTLARQLWPREDAVGKRVSFGPRIPEMEIIGIAADVRNEGLREEPAGTIYVPISIFQRSTLKIFLRTQGDPRMLIPVARAAIRQIDPDQPISEIQPLNEAISESASRPRFYAWMLALFAALALTLAGSGLYAILSYGIAQRRREIGVRLALGAQRRDVLGLVLRDGLGAAALGAVLGLLLAAAASRVLGSLLYEVQPLDPEVFASAPLFLLIVAALASLRPALRASRTDPIEALRSA
jgi:predicted permease